MFKYTIVVPSHNRHQYLERSIKYFSNFEANIIYVDSSAQPYTKKLPHNICYFHLPFLSFPEKALFAIKQCHTEYIAFCADDDFLIESSLLIGITNLNANKKLTASVGHYLAFNENFNGEFFKPGKHVDWPDVERDCQKNIINYLSNYHQILWALYRRSTIELAYETIVKSKFSNDNFIELVIATVCAGTGGVSFIDQYWGVRELSADDHWGLRHSSLHTIKNFSEISNDVECFVRYLEPVVGKKNAWMAWNCYIEAGRSKDKYLIIRQVIPNRIWALARKLKKTEKVNAECLNHFIKDIS